jgi:hypothetical protein
MPSPRRLVLIPFCLAAVGLFVACAPASASTLALEERPLPFDLPLTHEQTDVRVVDAVAGSNGTAHLIVWAGFNDMHYLWLNASTGAVLDDGSIVDPNEQPGCGTWACARVWVESGHVVVYRTIENRVLGVRIFDEGSFASGVVTSVPLPDPIGTDPYYDYEPTVLEMARNASDGLRPSIVVVNAGYIGYPVAFSAVEAVLFPLDLRNGTVGALRRLGQVDGLWPGYSDLYPTVWGVSSWWNEWWSEQSRYGCGVTLATGETWVFAPLATGLFAFSSGAPPTKLFTTSPSANMWVDCAIGPDGSAAAFLVATNRPNTSNITVAWARAVAGNATMGFLQNVTGGPMAFARARADASGLALLVGRVASDTAGPSVLVDTFTGWPANGSAAASGKIPGFVVAGFVLEGGAAPLLAVDVPRNPVNTSGTGAATLLPQIAFNGSWPALVRVSPAGSTWTEVGDWKPLVDAPVRSVAIVSTTSGAQLGGIVTRDNGTGRLHLLRADAGKGRFDVLDGPALPGEAVSVQAVPFGAGAILVVQTAAGHPSDRNYGYPAWNNAISSYLFFTMDVSGFVSTPVCPGPYAMQSCFGGYNNGPAPFGLFEDVPFPLLSVPTGLFALDPANATVSLLQQDGDYAISQPTPMLRNLTRINGLEQIPPRFWSTSSAALSQYPIEWWTEGGATWAAYPLSLGSAPNTTLGFRIARIGPGTALTWFNASLSTGAANDTISFQMVADLRAQRSPAGARAFTVVADQLHMWQRTFSIRFSTSNLTFEEVRLLSEGPSESFGYLVQVLAPWQGHVAHLRTREMEANGYTLARVMTLEALVFNGSAVERLAMPQVNFSCGWEDSGSVICPTWAPLTIAGEFAALVGFGGPLRFFGLNHLPTPPRLLAPANGSLLGNASVLFTVAPSTDGDGDRLTYHFSLYDVSGALVRQAWVSDPDWSATLPDGDYRWTAEVGDGSAWVASPDVFVFTLDATAPRADAGGPYILRYGGSLMLNGSNSRDNRGVVGWQWAVGPIGAGELTATGPTPQLSWSALLDLFAANGATLSIRLTVVDAAGHTDTDYTVVTLNATAVPIVEPVVLRTAFEGSPVDLATNVTWEGTDYLWPDPALFDGVFSILWSFPDGVGLAGPRVSYVPPDSGVVHVVVFVIPRLGPAGRAEFDLHVLNVAPAAAIDGPASLGEGETASYHVLMGDPSAADNASLTVEWSAGAGLVVVSAVGGEFQVRGSSDGPTQITVVVRDKDGGNTTATFNVSVTETVLPVAGLRIALNNTTWVDLQWNPSLEEDFVAYEITARFVSNGSRAGAAIQVKRQSDGAVRVEGLAASTEYTFTVVVVGKGGTRSAPAVAAGSTTSLPAPPPTSGNPPGGQPPPGGNGESLTAGVNPAWIVVLVLAGCASVVVVLFARQRRRAG